MQAMCSFGPVKGFEQNGIGCFLGIPYGKAGRFQAPKPCDPWEEEKDCTHFGKFAIETDEKENEWQMHGEDCLNLNIFTPSCQGRYPVVVNLHGGAFQNGAADRIAPFSRQVVFVDVNYRLGVWGFLQMPGLPSSGNNGILDQILALHWVKNEIAAFGGDPQRVTVMGLSAGAKSIGALLAAPSARDTFSQAILSSGAVQSIRSRRTADSVAREFFRFAGCEKDPDALFTMNATDLLKAQRAMCTGRNSTCLFGPVADGVVIPENWAETLFSGHGWKGRLLIGSNRREMMEDGNPDPASMAQDLYGDNAVWAEKAVEEERAGRALTKDQERLLWLGVHSDFMYRLHADRLAEKMSAFCPVWSYSFEFAPATHGFDHAVLFGDETGLEPLKQADFDRMHHRLCGIYESFVQGEAPTAQGVPDWSLCRAPEFYKMRLDTVCQAQPCPQGDSRRNFPDCVLVREQEGRNKA